MPEQGFFLKARTPVLQFIFELPSPLGDSFLEVFGENLDLFQNAVDFAGHEYSSNFPGRFAKASNLERHGGSREGYHEFDAAVASSAIVVQPSSWFSPVNKS
jgi:hypothetical protein